MAAYRLVTHVTCRLTVKNRDQLWNSTLGNGVLVTFSLQDDMIGIRDDIAFTCACA